VRFSKVICLEVRIGASTGEGGEAIILPELGEQRNNTQREA